LPGIDADGKNIFSSADHMGHFFEYEYDEQVPFIEEPVVYVANYKSLAREEIIALLRKKRVWAAGTKTWFELSKKGIWVEGSADALGLDFLEPVWPMPLVEINKEQVCVLTHREGEANWKEQGWTTASTYSLKQKENPIIEEAIRQADIIFWTSFRQYELYKHALKKELTHACPFGETAVLLRKSGLNPVIFPTIKAFQQWRKIFSPSRNAA
jgi:hypothetical protein